jgi:serine/threonine protein phosphatase PrpC
MLISKGYSDIGLKRKVNEDSFIINSNISLCVVSDGMGGYERGDIASSIIVRELDDVMSEYNQENEKTNQADEINQNVTNQIQSYLTMAIDRAKNKINKYANDNMLNGNIGATVAGIYKDIDIDKIAVFHIGDSRAYRIRKGTIEQLTIDHSVVEDMRRSGKYTEEEISKVGNNVLSKAIGNFGDFDLELNFYDLMVDDIFILCSDGVSNFISDELLLKYIIENTQDIAIEKIKQDIYKNGARDNFSIIVSKYL